MSTETQPTYPQNSLKNWHVDTIEHHGKTYTLIFGVFFNRPGIYDYTIGHTSPVENITIDYEQKTYLIQTKNTLYHCSFDSCFFERQDESKITLPDYEKIKAEFYKPIDTQTLSKDDMLLVLSDLCEYYFQTLIYQNEDGSKGTFSGFPHIGMLTDTYLIDDGEHRQTIDIRWYVNNSGIEFYSLDIGRRNLFVENRGNAPLTIVDAFSTIEILPGERKLIVKAFKNKI